MEQAFGRAMDQLRRPTRGRKFGSNRWKQARSMEGNVKTYPVSGDEPSHSEIMEKIQDIFQEQDESKKGFITREDMQKGILPFQYKAIIKSTQSEIWRIWVQLRKDEPDLLGNLKEFLAKMTHLIKEAKHAKEMLQFMLKMRVADHNKEVQQLYEEMEQQIEREKQRLQNESKTRSRLYSMEMKKVLSIKEQEIQHFLGIQKELEMQLLTLREKQHTVITQTQELKQTNSVLENQLQETLCQLQQTQRQLDTMKNKISQMHKEGR
ncbi:hypothetical protein JD844_018255 [Phrynosoma platyrhinos]|uniref:EF-hand domain-containing protein n=1 Tax=Phrynosoma platyrhinos TaxID=52577 RepID=A0ABQ7SNB6_PHRPL|nr:hypothetical protein JD844_018255 [Phrynosoma platyrhinos]